MRKFLFLTTLFVFGCSGTPEFELDGGIDYTKFKSEGSPPIIDVSAAEDTKSDFGKSIINAVNHSKTICLNLDKPNTIYQFNPEFFEIEATFSNMKMVNEKCDIAKGEITYVGYYLENFQNQPKKLHVVYDCIYDCRNYTYKFDYYISSNRFKLYKFIPFPYLYNSDMMNLVRNTPNKYNLNLPQGKL